jgi:hypothetical protein
MNTYVHADSQVSQATQETKEEAEQAANNLKEVINQLEESMGEKKNTKNGRKSVSS